MTKHAELKKIKLTLEQRSKLFFALRASASHFNDLCDKIEIYDEVSTSDLLHLERAAGCVIGPIRKALEQESATALEDELVLNNFVDRRGDVGSTI